MVALGYMKYLQDRELLAKISNELGGVENVLLRRSLIKKVIEKFNLNQQNKKDADMKRFHNSYINGEYGFQHPSAGERIRMHNELSTWHHLINYREAKKMLREYYEIQDENQ